jgi:hypothetical protein
VIPKAWTPLSAEQIALDAETERYRETSRQWTQLLNEDRGLKGFENFLLRAPLELLRTAAGLGRALVILNTSKYFCDALLINSSGEIDRVPLPDLTVESHRFCVPFWTSESWQRTFPSAIWLVN